MIIFRLIFGLGILGVIGDLFESLVKRAGFAKDSGIFFPGPPHSQTHFYYFFLNALFFRLEKL